MLASELMGRLRVCLVVIGLMGSLLCCSEARDASDADVGENGAGEAVPCDDGHFCTLTDRLDAFGACVGTGNPCAGTALFCDEATTACVPQVMRVTATTNGEAPADAASHAVDVTPDGRYVLFSSWSAQIVDDDTNGEEDLFVRDRRTGRTTRVNVSSTGAQAHGGKTIGGSLSDNGRFVAFQSEAANLVPGDTNREGDVFVHDLETGKTARASISSDGRQALGGRSYVGAISGEGRLIAFSSEATNLVGEDRNNKIDVFLHDRETGVTTRVSVSSTGEPGNGESDGASISADGRFVGFRSYASNLVSGDANSAWDAFLHDLDTGTTTRVSVASGGAEARHGDSYAPSVSGDGRYAVFDSAATNLSGNFGDGSHYYVYFHDRKTMETSLVSVSSKGDRPWNGLCWGGSVSDDGRFVAFTTEASNLTPDDNNLATDVLLHDRSTGETTPVGGVLNHGGAASEKWGMDGSLNAMVAGSGRFVVFDADWSGYVPGEPKAHRNVFIAVNPAGFRDP